MPGTSIRRGVTWSSRGPRPNARRSCACCARSACRWKWMGISSVEGWAARLAGSLVVEKYYFPLESSLPAAASVAPLFDACLARPAGRDLHVAAFLEDRGQDAEDLARRHASLGAALEASSARVGGRIYATL